MRIAVITPLFPSPASPLQGIYIYNTVRSLEPLADVEVFHVTVKIPQLTFARRKRTGPAAAKSGELPGGAKVRRLAYRGIPWLTRALNSTLCRRILQPEIESFAPDLILAYWTHPAGHAAVAVGRALGVPVIVGALGSDLLRSRGIGRRLARRAVTTADGVLTVSDNLRRAAISLGAPPDRVRTIRNGCDPAVFCPRDRAASRARLGIDSAARLVLFVGWLAPLKGLPELVAAMSAVRRNISSAELLCIGEGPLRSWLRSLPPESGVRSIGGKNSAEIADWLGAANLLCLPSRSEGCPNVVVEALSCGRPVVATSVGGIPELVDEDSGILVPPRDAARLAAAISTALTHRWSARAIAARRSRNWEDVARETYAVCMEISAKLKRATPETLACTARGTARATARETV